MLKRKLNQRQKQQIKKRKQRIQKNSWINQMSKQINQNKRFSNSKIIRSIIFSVDDIFRDIITQTEVLKQRNYIQAEQILTEQTKSKEKDKTIKQFQKIKQDYEQAEQKVQLLEKYLQEKNEAEKKYLEQINQQKNKQKEQERQLKSAATSPLKKNPANGSDLNYQQSPLNKKKTENIKIITTVTDSKKVQSPSKNSKSNERKKPTEINKIPDSQKTKQNVNILATTSKSGFAKKRNPTITSNSETQTDTTEINNKSSNIPAIVVQQKQMGKSIQIQVELDNGNEFMEQKYNEIINQKDQQLQELKEANEKILKQMQAALNEQKQELLQQLNLSKQEQQKQTFDSEIISISLFEGQQNYECLKDKGEKLQKELNLCKIDILGKNEKIQEKTQQIAQLEKENINYQSEIEGLNKQIQEEINDKNKMIKINEIQQKKILKLQREQPRYSQNIISPIQNTVEEQTQKKERPISDRLTQAKMVKLKSAELIDVEVQTEINQRETESYNQTTATFENQIPGQIQSYKLYNPQIITKINKRANYYPKQNKTQSFFYQQDKRQINNSQLAINQHAQQQYEFSLTQLSQVENRFQESSLQEMYSSFQNKINQYIEEAQNTKNNAYIKTSFIHKGQKQKQIQQLLQEMLLFNKNYDLAEEVNKKEEFSGIIGSNENIKQFLSYSKFKQYIDSLQEYDKGNPKQCSRLKMFNERIGFIERKKCRNSFYQPLYKNIDSLPQIFTTFNQLPSSQQKKFQQQKSLQTMSQIAPKTQLIL